LFVDPLIAFVGDGGGEMFQKERDQKGEKVKRSAPRLYSWRLSSRKTKKTSKPRRHIVKMYASAVRMTLTFDP